MKRVAWKHIHYHACNAQPAGVCSMTQGAETWVLRDRLEGWRVEGSFKSEGTYEHLRLIHVDLW